MVSFAPFLYTSLKHRSSDALGWLVWDSLWPPAPLLMPREGPRSVTSVILQGTVDLLGLASASSYPALLGPQSGLCYGVKGVSGRRVKVPYHRAGPVQGLPEERSRSLLGPLWPKC